MCRSPIGRRAGRRTSAPSAANDRAMTSAASARTSDSEISSASQMAASSSLEASLRPRSTSDR